MIKETKARKAILNILSNDCKPMDADAIYSALRDKINKVTVYRNLAYLEKNNVISRIDLHKDSIFYELSKHHHHHIVCSKCGVFEKTDECIINDVLKKSKKFSRINTHSLEFFGICNSCGRKR